MKVLKTAEDVRDLNYPGVPYYFALGRHPNLETFNTEVCSFILTYARDHQITSLASLNAAVAAFGTELNRVLQPHAPDSQVLDFVAILRRDIFTLCRMAVESGASFPIPVVLCAWHCPRKEYGIINGPGPTSMFWPAVATSSIAQSADARHLTAIPFAWDVVFACLNAPKLEGKMLEASVQDLRPRLEFLTESEHLWFFALRGRSRCRCRERSPTVS
ncbi:hypothetical protein CF326_g9473 [Tilletia indica]|nr:hypothetical protein CF326_g9473 [Tilletia indica]